MPNLINGTAWIMGIVPTVLLAMMSAQFRERPYEWGALISSLLWIALGIWQLGLFLELLSQADLILFQQPKNTIWTQLRDSGAFWLAALPPVTAGIGVNLLSTWLTTAKPK